MQFSGAEVMPVSLVPSWGRAEASSVSLSPCLCVLCAKFVALLSLGVGVSAKKFAQRAQNTPISAFLRLLGEFFRGSAAGWAVPGEFFAERSPEGLCWANFVARGPRGGMTCQLGSA